MLARGELQTIGATTLEEYRKHIEKDAALERRFQPIQVDQPSVAHTVEILKGLRDRYEAHHKVTITDAALVAAANLADRYVNDRFLPDKAIDLIDEAGARLRIRRLTAPPELKEFDAHIEDTRTQKEEAIDGQDFELAASLRDEEQKLKTERDEKEKAWRHGESDAGDHGQRRSPDRRGAGSLHGHSDREAHRGGVLATAPYGGRAAQRVIGQNEAIKAISRAIRRTRAGL